MFFQVEQVPVFVHNPNVYEVVKGNGLLVAQFVRSEFARRGFQSNLKFAIVHLSGAGL